MTVQQQDAYSSYVCTLHHGGLGRKTGVDVSRGCTLQSRLLGVQCLVPRTARFTAAEAAEDDAVAMAFIASWSSFVGFESNLFSSINDSRSKKVGPRNHQMQTSEFSSVPPFRRSLSRATGYVVPTASSLKRRRSPLPILIAEEELFEVFLRSPNPGHPVESVPAEPTIQSHARLLHD